MTTVMWHQWGMANFACDQDANQEKTEKYTMRGTHPHTFHIPVMGLGFTIDTPLKVARFGISSALSLADDHLLEQMRHHYACKYGYEYKAISPRSEDCRARRITAYLDLLHDQVDEQVERLRQEAFEPTNEIMKYFELLPDTSPIKQDFVTMLSAEGAVREAISAELRKTIVAGAIDVNIMTKVDKTNYGADGQPLPPEYSDALAALRGFAQSKLRSSVILSAGLNPRLYSYFEAFDDFFPDNEGHLTKKIILKVSDYRSALIQGKLLAKKGLWVSEFRVESGVNCGGHAFINDGMLLGPIMETFKMQRQTLYAELIALCETALQNKRRPGFKVAPIQRITVQGGIGTAEENRFLMDQYQLDGTGWGSPFLLVPEVTNVDDDTLQQLLTAEPADFYLSDASPLGVPFHNFRKSSSEEQRKQRISRSRPGSPCHKKFLSFNSEFTEQPICTASRQYQHLKLKEARLEFPNEEDYQKAAAKITEKDCLCEGLAAPAVLTNQIPPTHNLKAVTICPGPNLAYFSSIATLKEMVDHIYGKANLLNSLFRPNLFVNELKLYLDYLKKEIDQHKNGLTEKKDSYFRGFQENLHNGIRYYETLLSQVKPYAQLQLDDMKRFIAETEKVLLELTNAKECRPVLQVVK